MESIEEIKKSYNKLKERMEDARKSKNWNLYSTYKTELLKIHERITKSSEYIKIVVPYK